MLCEQVLGNICDLPPGKRHDPVLLAWHECGNRSLRRRSREGREVVILLPPGQVLEHGDVLFEDDVLRVVVELIPCQVLVACAQDLQQMGRLAFELGNLHVAAQIAGTEILVQPDGPVEEVLHRLGVPYSVEIRRFTPYAAATVPVRLAERFEVVRQGD